MKNHEPKSFIQCESLAWHRCNLDPVYQLNDYVLTYHVRGAGRGLDAVGMSIGNDIYSFLIASADTAQMQPGDYSWQLIASKNDSKVLIDSGTFQVKPGLATMTADQTFDGRSENKKILDAIRALVAGKATLDQQSYAIGNRQLARIPIPDLIVLEQKFTQKVARENQAERIRKGGNFFKQVHLRLK